MKVDAPQSQQARTLDPTGAKGAGAAQAQQARGASGIGAISGEGAAGAVGPQVPATASPALLSAATSGTNPFTHLLAGGTAEAAALASLGRAVNLDADAAPSAKAAAGLARLESAAAGLGKDEGLQLGLLGASGKVRHGLMLLYSDGADAAARKGGFAREVAGHTAETLVEKHLGLGRELAVHEGKMAATMQQAMFAQKAHFPAGMDINAYVQAVLRESYLLQNEILKDYADKVKFHNALKKQTREQLARAREARMALEKGQPLSDEQKAAMIYWSPEEQAYVSVYGDERYPADEDGRPVLGAVAEAPESVAGEGLGEASAGLSGGGPGPELDPQVASQEIHRLSRRIAEVEAELGWQPGEEVVVRREPVEGLPERIVDNNVSATHDYEATTLGALERGALEYIEELCTKLMAIGPEAKREAAIKALIEQGCELCFTGRHSGSYDRGQVEQRFVLQGIHTVDQLEDALKAQVHSWVEAHAGSVRPATSCKVDVNVFEFGFPDPSFQVKWQESVPKTKPESLATLEAQRDALRDEYHAYQNARREQRIGADLDGDGVIGGAGRGGDEADEGEAAGDPPASTSVGRDGDATSATAGEGADAEAAFDSYISTLEDTLSSIGDDAQLANVDLQNALQQQQQTLQMMSNISKMLHETAMAIIRKIGG